MKVTFTLSIGIGAGHRETFEYDDDVTEETLQDDWNAWIWNYIDGGFNKEKD